MVRSKSTRKSLAASFHTGVARSTPSLQSSIATSLENNLLKVYITPTAIFENRATPLAAGGGARSSAVGGVVFKYGSRRYMMYLEVLLLVSVQSDEYEEEGGESPKR